MPTGIITAIATAVSAAVTAAGGLGGILAAVGKAILGMVVSQLLSSAFGAKPKKPSQSTFDRTAQDRTQMIRSPIEPRRIVYGTAVVSGPIVYATSSGDGNKYMHIVIPLATHECAGIDDVWVNDKLITNAMLDGSGNVTSGDLSGLIRIKKFLGGSGQAASTDLISEAPSGEWTATAVGAGVTYIYIRAEHNQDRIPNGIQNVKAKVRGRLVYDPRTATTAHSNNWALCALDYLRSDFGLSAGSHQWTDTHYNAMANICDEDVTLDAGGATQKRYTCDGSFTLDQAPIDVMEDLLTAAAGVMVFTQGQYFAFPAYLPAGPYPALDTSMLRGTIRGMPRRSRRDLSNAVRGTFVNPEKNWLLSDFPMVKNATYKSQDNNRDWVKEIQLPYTTDVMRAQRLAKIHLEHSRQALTTVWELNFTPLDIACWDVVEVTVPDSAGLGFVWTSKLFRVIDWTLRPNGVDLTMKEEAAGVYDWNFGEATTIDLAPDTELATPFDNPPNVAGLALSSGDDELDVRIDGTVFSRLRVSWTTVANVFVRQGGWIEVQYRKQGETVWANAPAVAGSDTSVRILDVVDGEIYDVRVRAVNSLGVPSLAWTEFLGHTVAGKSAPPSAPDTFTFAGLPDGSRRFDWTHASRPADVRVGGGYQIRYALTPEADWVDMEPLHDGVLVSSPYRTTDLAAGTYNFAIKSIDSSGNESTTAATISSAALDDPPLAGALSFRDERGLGWPGTKTSCYIEDGILKAVSDFQWDDATGTWDSYTSPWDSMGADISPIRYESELIDLGANALMKPIASATGNGTITIEMKSWLDGGSDPGTWSAIAQVTARYVKIRWSVAATNPTLKTASVIIDAPSVVDYINDVNTATETNNQSWYYRAAAGDIYVIARNGLAVNTMARINALQNVAGAFTWELVSKNATKPGGWTNAASGPAAQFRIRNATPALADATIDIELRGPRG